MHARPPSSSTFIVGYAFQSASFAGRTWQISDERRITPDFAPTTCQACYVLLPSWLQAHLRVKPRLASQASYMDPAIRVAQLMSPVPTEDP